MKEKTGKLANVKGKLSRHEMSQILAGNENDNGDGTCTIRCTSGRSECSSIHGDCVHDDYNNKICCDGLSYAC